MVNSIHLLKPTVAAFVLLMSCLQSLIVPGAALAQENPPVTGQTNPTAEAEANDKPALPQDLEGMLAALPEAEAAEAERLARQIRRLWDASGSATADFLLKRAREAVTREDMTAALEHATALVDHAPEFAQGWAERARTLYALNLYGPALSDLEQVLALNPQHFDAIMGLAVMLDEMGQSEDAYEAYLQVKAIHPHQAGLTEALARLEPLARGRSL